MKLFPALIVALMIGLAGFALSRSLLEWQANNQQPVVSVAAEVVAKRADVRGRGSADSGLTRTYYYGTFEDQTGIRREFRLSGQEYGQLAEGDKGILTYQGSRYHSFQRRSSPTLP
ncbi:MAG: DUF2500 domain-containing protein [Leptolyngbya sp. IPPAS B-1204]|nr:DUF2500 domain-containing protein [Elainella sp. C42_A2020_010]RNJ69832.1 MAG: DUF2500 domain-containing protein [Leptolyngbya sp. IPPAS B-1204]